ncbi:MAG: peptidoglycan DD-metalloendopeptidase family protein [Paracoccus sp. (in: a-proteobacteria)]
MQVDPAFQSHRRSARRRRNRGRALRVGLVAACLLVAGGLGWVFWSGDDPRPTAGPPPDSGDEAQMVQVAEAFDVAPVVRADTFTDLPGDPLILRLAEDGQDGRSLPLPGPPTLDVGRVGLPAPDRLMLVNETLHVRERRLMTALPSSPEDFALFQSQRTRSMDLLEARAEAPAPIDPLTMTEAEKTPAPVAASTLFLRAESERQPLSRELVLDLELPTPLPDLLRDNGFQAAEIETIMTGAGGLLPLGEALPAGTVLAIRYDPAPDAPRLQQLSLYGPKGWLGSVAREGRDRLVAAADPWIDADILELAHGGDEDAGAGLQYRLLDVIYSAAIRAEVPTEIVGEVIAMMAQVHDLGGYADPGDRLTLVFARDHGAGGALAGQVLFAGVDGPSGSKPCYVVPREDRQGFRCHAPGARVARVGDGGIVMTLPVSGTIRRKFGAEMAGDSLPGVEFAAAKGAPVLAAAAGQVREIGGEDGALSLTLDHGGGLLTRYAGLSAITEGLAPGAAIAAGGVLGRVGQSGGGDGLFFQAFQSGQAVNPMPFFTGGQTVLASDAVEALIGRIIRVESAGNAMAQNPLSSATGLGQFIDSTWLRMMASYRPDLAASMSRRDLLDLRFNPDLSREMVRHLAQENEAYLRARGHQITAGRLYLAHFLGPEGAHRVLSAAEDASVLQVMGAGVVNANPFLGGYSIARLKGWADRKMNAAPVLAATPEPEREAPPSPAVLAFVAAMDAMLAENLPDRG